MTVERWWPNDYSPCYDVEVDDDGAFVRLRHLWSYHPGYPGATDRLVEQPHVRAVSEAFVRQRWPSLTRGVDRHVIDPPA